MLGQLAQIGQPGVLGMIEVLRGHRAAQPCRLPGDRAMLVGIGGAPGQLAQQLEQPGQDEQIGSAVAARLSDPELEHVGESTTVATSVS